MTLQRTIGNAAVSALLRRQADGLPRQAKVTEERCEHAVGNGIGSESPRESSLDAPATAVAVQRAMGVELEVTKWHVQHKNKSRLPKGTEPIITDNAGKYVLSADDDGERSDIEYVTDALDTREDSERVVGRMSALAKDIEKAGNSKLNFLPWKKTIPATKFKKHGSANKNAFLVPGESMKAHIQATLSVPLEKVPALFKQFVGEKEVAFASTNGSRSLALAKKALKGPLPGDVTPSDQLKGFLMLVIDYIVQGFLPKEYRKTANNNFPKEVLHLLAKTRFDQIIKLVPEYEQLLDTSQERLKDEWIDWILQAALGKLEKEALEEARNDTVLNQTFSDNGEDPYKIDITREDWLGKMPKDDLLSEKRDMKTTDRDKGRLQGIGAFGHGTDKLSKESEEGLVLKMEKSLHKEVLQSEEKEHEKEKGDEKQDIEEKPSNGSESEGTKGPSSEAPIFELRQVEMAGGTPDTWQANVDNLWKLHDQVLGKNRYRKQKK